MTELNSQLQKFVGRGRYARSTFLGWLSIELGAVTTKFVATRAVKAILTFMIAKGIDPALMRGGAPNACRLMKVLSNPDRLLLLSQLSLGEARVGELEELLGIEQPTLSQQLTVLRVEGLVKTRRDGKAIYYQLSSPEALAVMQVMQQKFCGPS